jgi:hypothetical protein
MRDADERALILQAPERLLRRKSFRDFFLHKRSQDLTAGRRNFFSDNDKLRIERPGCTRTRNGVVIGHDNPVDSLVPTGSDQIFRTGEGVLREYGMAVELNIAASGQFHSDAFTVLIN